MRRRSPFTVPPASADTVVMKPEKLMRRGKRAKASKLFLDGFQSVTVTVITFLHLIRHRIQPTVALNDFHNFSVFNGRTRCVITIHLYFDNSNLSGF